MAADAPSMRTARQRISWASLRHGHLAAMAEELRQANDETALTLTISREAYEKGEDTDAKLDWSGYNRPKFGDWEVQLVASEVIHHARTTLDYVAYNLSWHYSRRQRTGTAFPIAADRSNWSTAKKALKGLPARVVGRVEAFQPYAGTAWTGALQRLSNDDKHKFVFAVTTGPGITFRIAPDTVEEIPDQPDRLRIKVEHYDADVFITEVEPMVPALWEILLGVCDVIDEFQSDLGESIPLTITPPPGVKSQT